MRILTSLFAALALLLGSLAITAEAETVDIKDPENTLVIEVEGGEIVIELLPDVAPNHVARVKELAREGFYNGVPFHRVIDGFMAQTGDGENGDGTGGSTKPDLKAEFNDTPYVRGTVGMARTNYPHSANSQFFITFGDTPHLNGQYTVFGQVIGGMDLVDGLKKGSGAGGSVADPDKMLKVSVAADK